MLSITPINNNCYNRTVNFKANQVETGSKPRPSEDFYAELYQLMKSLVPEDIESKETAVETIESEKLPVIDNGWTKLHYLCLNPYSKDALEFIANHPNFDVNQLTDSGASYIELAMSPVSELHHKVDLINKLAENEALDLSITNKYGWNVLHRLIKYGYTKAVQNIIDNHPNIDMRQLTDEGLSYESIARIYNHKDIIRIFEKIHR